MLINTLVILVFGRVFGPISSYTQLFDMGFSVLIVIVFFCAKTKLIFQKFNRE